MKKVAIHSLLSEKHSGEWGAEAVEGSPSSVCIVRTANFNNDGTLDFENIVKREIDSRKISKKQLKDGDLLLEKSGGSPTQPVGRVIYFVQPNDNIFLSNNFTTLLRPNRALVFPAYLFHALFTNHAKGNTVKYQNKTTGIINLKLDEYLESEIFLPPLDEQRRIATILDKATAICRKRQEALKLADAFVKSVFLDMFGDPVLNPKGWKIKNLDHFIDFLTSGSRGWSEFFSSAGEYFLTIKNVRNGQISIHDVQYVNAPDNKEALRTKVYEKDMVISITADLGRTGVVSKEVAQFGAYINQHLSLVRLRHEIVNVVFVSHFLESTGGKMQFEAKNQVGVKAGLNFDAIKSLQIPLPPLPLQNRFAEIVQRVEAHKQRLKAHLAEAEQMKKALQQLFFG